MRPLECELERIREAIRKERETGQKCVREVVANLRLSGVEITEAILARLRWETSWRVAT